VSGDKVVSVGPVGGTQEKVNDLLSFYRVLARQIDKPVELSQNTYDAVIIAALAMTEAKTTDGKVWVDHILKVSNPPGTQCFTYASCVQLLKDGKKINFEGASGPEDFDQYHNTFGDWDIVQFNADASSTNVVLHVGADAIAKVSAAAG